MTTEAGSYGVGTRRARIIVAGFEDGEKGPQAKPKNAHSLSKLELVRKSTVPHGNSPLVLWHQGPGSWKTVFSVDLWGGGWPGDDSSTVGFMPL